MQKQCFDLLEISLFYTTYYMIMLLEQERATYSKLAVQLTKASLFAVIWHRVELGYNEHYITVNMCSL